jgi:CRP-like cAMP-binding protein
MLAQRDTIKMFEGLPDELKTEIIKLLQPVHLKKGEAFIRQGMMSDKVGFVVNGIIYAYLLKDGEEKTIHISSIYNSVAAFDCLLLNQPSQLIYKALTDTELMVTSFSALQELYKTNELADQLSKEFMRLQLADAYQRTTSFIIYTPLERYQQLQKEHPEVINQIPQKVLASYLGITPVSLSRIRKRVQS